MELPETVEIQVIDKSGCSYPLEHILFGLKIYNEDGSYYNYSNLKTDKKGKVVLTSQQIIENTELKWEKEQVCSLQKTKFEIYIWDGQDTSQLIESVKSLLKLYSSEELIIEDLRKRGISGEAAETAMVKTRNQSIADRQFYEFIKPVINNEIEAETKNVVGYWLDSLPKKYQFKVNLLKNNNA